METKAKTKMGRRKFVAVLLSVVMAFGAFTATAVAAGTVPGYAPGVNTQFWWTDTDLTTEYPQELVIGGTTYNFELGRNTIQEYFYDSSANTYVVSLHPQFFGTTFDYDDQDDAYYIMNITSVLIWDGRDYVDCLSAGVAVIPAAYAVTDPTTGKTFFPCEVVSTITDIRTGATTAVAWSGKPIYLEVPAGL